MKRFSIITLIIAVLIPLLIGGVSAALSSQGMALYENMNKPLFSPPAWVFSIAWTILYIMMGIASYFVIMAQTQTASKVIALILYGVQLAMNFMWSIAFFNWDRYLFAFIWLVVMWCIVIICTVRFFAIRRVAGWFMMPYVLWLTFAAYLNFGAYMLNKM